MNFLERFFHLRAAGTNIRTEVAAGVTTFLSMAYIIAVNPAMLSNAGMDFGGVFVATCLAALSGCLLMGLLANYPVALAPGMGQNAFFTFSVVIAAGHSWQVALGAVFLSGVLFVILSVLPAREWIINSVPMNLKLGIAAGIGLFLATVGLRNAGILVDNPATLVSFGKLTDFGPLMAIAGFILIVGLTARRVPGSIVIGILATAVIGWVSGLAEFHGIASLPPSPAPVLLQLDILGALHLSLVTVILTLLVVDVFDTAGTLVAVATRGRMLDADGHLPRLRPALLADSGATLLGSLFGTSSTTSYLESAAGVESGGRTGLTAVVVALLFLLALLLAPLAQSIPAYATAAALIFVATLMISSVARVDWEDATEACPAAIIAIAIPLSFSIADGIGIGLICYAAIKMASGRPRECPITIYVLAAIFAIKFALL